MKTKQHIISIFFFVLFSVYGTASFGAILGGGDYDTYDLPGITMGYDSAIVFYPTSGNGPFPAVTMSGGWTNTKEDMEWICIDLVEAGFIVLAFTPQRRILALPWIWERGHNTAYETIEEENVRAKSPIRGKVNTNKIGMCGFSMGGGGVINAANNNVTGVKATVAMAPWEVCTFRPLADCDTQSDNITTPVFIFGGTNDRLALDQKVTQMYDAVPAHTERLLAIFDGMNHYDMFGIELFKGDERDEVATYMIAFLKVYLSRDSSYQNVLEGDDLQDNINDGWFYTYKYNGATYVEQK